MPNSVVLRHYGNDYVRFFWFASNHKLRVSNGSWNNIQAKQKLIEEHIFVDSLTLMLLQHYGCLDAIKEIPHVHICYSTLEVIQNNYHVWSASSDVHEILLWVKNATNVVFEPDGYVFESSLSSLFEEEYIKCCRCAATNDIPLLTIETSIEDFSKMEEQGSFKNIQTVGVVSLCHATLSKTPEKLNKTLYNLLGHCTFINFHAETIVAQIISNDYVVDKSALSRFFICNTSCDMISFERVYFGTLMLLFSEHRDAAIDFAMIVLENAVSIWRKGTHYRFLVERFNDEEARVKSESILRYLVLLLYDLENTFKDGIPKKIQGLYENIRKSIYKHFGNKMIQEIKSSFVFLDD